jgi:hypothetical protein
MTLRTKIVLNDIIEVWFEQIMHNTYQRHGFVLVHCSVLPGDTVQRQGTKCCSVIVLYSGAVNVSCTYMY